MGRRRRGCSPARRGLGGSACYLDLAALGDAAWQNQVAAAAPDTPRRLGLGPAAPTDGRPLRAAATQLPAGSSGGGTTTTTMTTMMRRNRR